MRTVIACMRVGRHDARLKQGQEGSFSIRKSMCVQTSASTTPSLLLPRVALLQLSDLCEPALACVQRNPFNPITGMERPGHVPDSFLPRGLAPVPTHEARDAWEHNRRMDADVRLRMFKLPNPDSASLQTRAKHIADNGIADFAAKRRSSEIGYGRPDLASAGASEAFSGAQYGGQRASDRALAESALLKQRLAAGELDDRTQMLASFQGIVPKDPWDVAVMAADPERHARRLAATTRAPNRVFDTVTAPVHLPTQPDPVQRALREIRELQSSRPGRPMDRPQAFTATAGRMASMRVQAVKQAERDMVARLTQL